VKRDENGFDAAFANYFGYLLYRLLTVRVDAVFLADVAEVGTQRVLFVGPVH